MPKRPHISDAEWQVMEIAWERAPITANDIVRALANRTSWSPQTIKTMLNRLVKKGALKFEAEGKRYLYRPAVSKEASVRGVSRSFLQRVFGGDVGPMLAHFVEEANLTPDQIRELRSMLKEKK